MKNTVCKIGQTEIINFSGCRWRVRIREGPDAKGLFNQGQHQGEGRSLEPTGPPGYREQPDGRDQQPDARKEGGGGAGPESGRRHGRGDDHGGGPAAAVDGIDRQTDGGEMGTRKAISRGKNKETDVQH